MDEYDRKRFETTNKTKKENERKKTIREILEEF